MSVWTAATLVTDADLTAQESRMPDQAQRVVADSGGTAYDGKRGLVKADLTSWIKRRGLSAAGVLDPTEFNRAATFLELSYIYRDMAQRNDVVASGKSDFYHARYVEEIEGLDFDYEAPTATATTHVRPLAYLWRS